MTIHCNHPWFIALVAGILMAASVRAVVLVRLLHIAMIGVFLVDTWPHLASVPGPLMLMAVLLSPLLVLRYLSQEDELLDVAENPLYLGAGLLICLAAWQLKWGFSYHL